MEASLAGFAHRPAKPPEPLTAGPGSLRELSVKAATPALYGMMLQWRRPELPEMPHVCRAKAMRPPREIPTRGFPG